MGPFDSLAQGVLEDIWTCNIAKYIEYNPHADPGVLECIWTCNIAKYIEYNPHADPGCFRVYMDL